MSDYTGHPNLERSHLEVSIQTQDTEAVDKLIAQDINVNSGTSNGVPPLHQALQLDLITISTLVTATIRG